MSLSSNAAVLATASLADFPGTLSARLASLRDCTCTRPAPDGWKAELEGLLAGAEPVRVELVPVAHKSPCAEYADVRVALSDGSEVRGRLIMPAGTCRPDGAPVPLVLMFHDAGRPVRGWHHMTRFVALGAGVLALDQGVIEPERAAAELPALAADALAFARAGLGLPGVDRSHVFTWGEGVGGALAVIVAAALGSEVERCAVCNPFPADTGELPAHLDPALLATRVSARLLVGCGLRDELALPEAQMAVANGTVGPTEVVFYPEHAHERINEFENEVLRFFRVG